MNTPLRRVAVGAMVMIVLLLANLTYIQVIKADSYRSNPRNQRSQLDEYVRQRGQIEAGNWILARSVPSDDRYKFARIYPTDTPGGPEAYAPVTGIYGLATALATSSTQVEFAQNDILTGSDNRMFGRRLLDMFAGRDPRGGHVVTTINPVMQQVAYEQLTKRGYTGSVVAMDPQTGRILTMVSTPSFDPNSLASHSAKEVGENFEALTQNEKHPMLNRATAQVYPPGSTFKVVLTAAALADGAANPDTQLTAAGSMTLPGTSNVPITNYASQPCGGGQTASLRTAFALSCNTAFVELSQKVGAVDLERQASAFGIGPKSEGIPIRVADSEVGPLVDSNGTVDRAALGQSAIGQREVKMTPLDNCVIAATVANGGKRMHPYLISELLGPDRTELASTRPTVAEQAISPEIAGTLTSLMIDAEQHAGGRGIGVPIASKTGTAEHGTEPEHAWYIAFAPANDPKIAISVIVENAGTTGAQAAAPVAREVLRAGLAGE